MIQKVILASTKNDLLDSKRVVLFYSQDQILHLIDPWIIFNNVKALFEDSQYTNFYFEAVHPLLIQGLSSTSMRLSTTLVFLANHHIYFLGLISLLNVCSNVSN